WTGARMPSRQLRRSLIPICLPLGKTIGRFRLRRKPLFARRAKSIPLITSCPERSLLPPSFFKEFWQPAQLGLSAAGANLLIEDQFSTLGCFSNAPGKESLIAQQIHIFEVALRHLTRALRISRRLWELE